MSSSVDLVIFDCDGVLVDSERLAVQVDVRLLATLGWEMTEDEVVERFVGRSDSAMKAVSSGVNARNSWAAGSFATGGFRTLAVATRQRSAESTSRGGPSRSPCRRRAGRATY
mgnify:CR=1 FL=1